jgi:hypothetical protein
MWLGRRYNLSYSVLEVSPLTMCPCSAFSAPSKGRGTIVYPTRSLHQGRISSSAEYTPARDLGDHQHGRRKHPGGMQRVVEHGRRRYESTRGVHTRCSARDCRPRGLHRACSRGRHVADRVCIRLRAAYHHRGCPGNGTTLRAGKRNLAIMGPASPNLTIMGALLAQLLFVDNPVSQISRDTDPGILARGPEPIAARCDLIHATLQLLLVRAHARAKTRRWAAAGSQSAETRAARGTPPPILRPLIDLIQYETFCERVRAEVNRVSHALASADIRARVRFSGLGDSSASVLRMVSDVDDGGRIGGEVVLRIDRRYAPPSASFIKGCFFPCSTGTLSVLVFSRRHL